MVLPAAAIFFLAWALATAGCKDKPVPKVPAPQSTLRQATDVFWAIDRLGYMISKEKPNPSVHGCKPNEYLAQKGDAQFRISVFECGDEDQAKAVVENADTQKVDSLLRNHGEGGVMQRGPMEIIVRMNKGDRQAAESLMDALGAL